VNVPTLLDLYCGAGGCSAGYARAGFTEIVGVDARPQPRYPFQFVQGDALAFLAEHGKDFDFIHASPPCQRFSLGTNARGKERIEHPDLVTPTRDLLLRIGRPWIIENVPGANLRAPAVQLCVLMFSLTIFRHRWFESSEFILVPDHPGHGNRRIGEGGFVTVAGHGPQNSGWHDRKRPIPADHRNKASWQRAMGIDWMTVDELAQAIPPSYTEFLGRQLIARL